MSKKIFLSSILCIIFLLPFCSRLTYDVVPHQTAQYHSLRIKVNARNTDTGQKQSFKILLKYDHTRDKMFFLSPLNQVYGLLLLEGEKALLINTKKKKYWQGKFNHLLKEIWRLDFNYREFKQLLVQGKLPEDKLKKQNIKISFAGETTNPNQNPNQEPPQRMQILSGDLLLKIKISGRKTGKGKLSFAKNLKGMKKTGIRELLEAEDE